MHKGIVMFARIAIISAASTLGLAQPAIANDVAIEGIIPAVETVQTGAGDAEFGDLFASWEELEAGGRVTQSGDILAAPRSAVSVPSRMPVDGVTLTSGFGMRNHPILRKRRHHNGVDLAAPRGTPVYATADGMIGRAFRFSSYGNYVEIEHGGDLQTRYAHLQRYTVRAGDEVKKGDLIGYVGSTGRSTGPHLHYEVRVDGEPVDPRPYMITELAIADDDADVARGGPE